MSGILNPVKNAKYETLANLTSIQGSLNNKFRENLSKVKEDLEKSIMSEQFMIDKIAGKEVVKLIVVPDKLVNIVVKG